jgi:pimeloyl-ACP methyl ester carboxylesterase
VNLLPASPRRAESTHQEFTNLQEPARRILRFILNFEPSGKKKTRMERNTMLKRKINPMFAFVLSLILVFSFTQSSLASDKDRIQTNDFFVPHISTVPAVKGQLVHLFVREKVLADFENKFWREKADGKVVLFVHGATFPSVPDFDLPFENYSWMEHLARAGFDVFAMDLTGYGESTRPFPMNDPCNTSPSSASDGKSGEAIIMPYPLTAPCAPTYPFVLNTSQTDWDDMNAVVDYLRARRHVDRINLIAWSQGGQRAGGYAALYPNKVDKMVLLAPVYFPTRTPTNPPSPIPQPGYPYTVTTQYHAYVERWFPGVLCENQYDPAILPAVWASYMKYDALGATWDGMTADGAPGLGVVRAPTYTSFGWNASMAAKVKAPTVLLSGVNDQQIPSEGVVQLCNDLGSTQKVFVSVACGSHNIPYERIHEVLYKASEDWLLHESIKGAKEGSLYYSTDGKFTKYGEGCQLDPSIVYPF